MRIADRLAPYSVLDPSWHYRDPRSVVIDLDLLAGPSLERTPDGTRWTGEQLVPADYRTVLDLVRAS